MLFRRFCLESPSVSLNKYLIFVILVESLLHYLGLVSAIQDL